MSLPYLLVLLIMTSLIMPYFIKDRGLVNRYSWYTTFVSSRAVWVLLAYGVYIIFAVTKSYMPGESATDAYGYYLIFSKADCSLAHFMTEVTTFEPGYSFIVWLVRQLTPEYKVMLWVWHTLTFFLIVGFFKNIYLEKTSFLVVFIGLTLLMTQFNTLRMSISISIALFSLFAIYERRWVRALIIILCAVCMHVSAVIMLPIWIVLFISYKITSHMKIMVFILVFCGILVVCSLFGFINNIALGTAKHIYVGHSSVSWGTDFAIIAFTILCYSKFDQLKEISGINEVLMMALPVGLVCIPLQLNMSAMYRLTLYFLPIMYALIPSIIQCYKKTNKYIKWLAVLLSYGYLLSRVYSFVANEIVYLNYYSILL